LISVSFTEVIQTLRTNPQIASFIYSIPTANNSQQDRDNSNNITKCLGFNKDSIESGIRMEVRNRLKVTDEDGFKRREEK
jgi:hypothetical protein